MTSTRPYLIRAIYEWVVDNGQTPYLLVDASQEGVDVPPERVSDQRIVLNLGPGAVHQLSLGNEWIVFGARFGGVAREVRVPVGAVLAVYAKENGQGMMFTDDDAPPPSSPPPSDQGPGGGRPRLKVVK